MGSPTILFSRQHKIHTLEMNTETSRKWQERAETSQETPFSRKTLEKHRKIERVEERETNLERECLWRVKKKREMIDGYIEMMLPL